MIGVANQFLRLRPPERADFRYRHPVIARHVRRGNDAFDLYQFRKSFQIAFEGDLARAHARVEVGDTIHLLANAEEQVVLPADFFRGVGKGETELPDPFQVRLHAENYTGWRWLKARGFPLTILDRST